MSYTGGWRPHIESALCLDLLTMMRRSYMWPGCDTSAGLQWGRQSGKPDTIAYHARLSAAEGELTLTYTEGTGRECKPIECHIWLLTVPCHYGGRRWYFRCPYTGRRALKLYKWPGVEWFCHREAIQPRPSYASERVGGMYRLAAQRLAIRHKLGDDPSDLCSEPMKPKWMRQRTFQRYLERDAELDARQDCYLMRALLALGIVDIDGLR